MGPASELPEVVADVGARSRRRIRYLFWAAAIVVLAGLAYAATIRSVRFEGEAPISFAPDAEAVSLPSFDGGAHAVLYRHGGTVSFSFPLHNDGLVPISVTGVQLDDEGPHPLLAVDEVEIGSEGLPARVGRGETVQVQVTGRFSNCRYYHERELELVEGATVEATALGLGITRHVDFDHPLVVRSPMIVDCPDRTLARDDDVRR